MLLRVLTWRVRINRLMFVAGFVFVQMIGGLTAAIIDLIVSTLVGEPGLIYRSASFAALLSAPTVCMVCGLIGCRAHDFDFTGVPFAVVYAAVILLSLSAIAQGPAPFGEALPSLAVYLLVGIVMLWLALAMLALIPGQRLANRFGPPPEDLLRRG